MKLVLPALFALTAFTLGATLTSRAPAAAPLVGPGGVIELHRQLFAAIDAGDADKAAALLDVSGSAGFADGEDGGIARPDLMWLDDHGLPESARGAEAARALLTRHAKASQDGGPKWSTKILKSRADCYSADLSYAVIEFERSRGVKGGTQRYFASALVRSVDGQWRVFHLHVSAADEETARLVSASSTTR